MDSGPKAFDQPETGVLKGQSARLPDLFELSLYCPELLSLFIPGRQMIYV
jgi:hypothetical protein